MKQRLIRKKSVLPLFLAIDLVYTSSVLIFSDLFLNVPIMIHILIQLLFCGSLISHHTIETSRNGIAFFLTCIVFNMAPQLTMGPCLMHYHCCHSAGEKGFPDSSEIWNGQITWNSSSEHLLTPIWEIGDSTKHVGKSQAGLRSLWQDRIWVEMQFRNYLETLVLCSVLWFYDIWYTEHGLLNDKKSECQFTVTHQKQESC